MTAPATGHDGAAADGRGALPPEARAMHGIPVSASGSAQNRLAAAMRRLSSLSIGRPIPDEELDAAAEKLEAIGAHFESVAEPGKRPRGLPDHAGHPQDLFPTSPMVGFGNPIAPPIDVWLVDGENGPELHGRAFFDYQYEGPPTCVHGGAVAELFDEMLGSANIVTGRAGMTGTLKVTYRKPTPLLTELKLVARQTGTEGRKIFAWGGLYHEGELTAEAEGIFIEMRVGRMLEIVTGNAEEASGVVIDAELQAFVDRGGQIQGVEGPPPT